MEPITTSEELAAVCARMRKHRYVTDDTEFQRVFSFFFLLCVVLVVFVDEAVVIDAHAPTAIERLGQLRALPKGFERSRWGEQIVEAVKRGVERDPKSLPRMERFRPAPNGGATVGLLKVLLRMTAEKNTVAAKVIATVDDLERIASDDEADVPALKGWRRELYGEKALALSMAAS